MHAGATPDSGHYRAIVECGRKRGECSGASVQEVQDGWEPSNRKERACQFWSECSDWINRGDAVSCT